MDLFLHLRISFFSGFGFGFGFGFDFGSGSGCRSIRLGHGRRLKSLGGCAGLSSRIVPSPNCPSIWLGLGLGRGLSPSRVAKVF